MASLAFRRYTSLYWSVTGMTKETGDLITLEQELRSSVAVGALLGRDENVQVNGYVLVIDMTGGTLKHSTRWSLDDMRNWNSCWMVRTCKLVPRSLNMNEKHLKNVGPIRHREPPHALISHCHSPGVATVARRQRIDVHDNDNNDDNA